jgi:predicted type IV restriction endonuclease
MGIDSAFETAKQVFGEATANLDNIRSEEDAKLQIITRVITEMLGWTHSEIASESHNDNGFSDYLINDGEHNALLIEAKRIGVIELATSTSSQSFYKISGPVLKTALPVIKQAASYRHPIGVRLAVVTDGVTWIIFLP